MGKRHNTLNDDIFRNSKYIATLENELKIEDFKKEYKEQYDIMLDVYKSLILINNILFADSNKNKKTKTNEIIDIFDKILYDENENNKYSTRKIKSLLDSNTRLLYNKFNEWYEKLSFNENYFDTFKSEIEKEMSLLENIGFDNIERNDLYFEKNKDSNYKIFISKLSDLYPLNNAILKQFKDDFNNNYGIVLTDNEMLDIAFIYDLIASANNGLSNIICKNEIIDFNLSERSSDQDYFNAYLKALHIDLKDDNLFNYNSYYFVKKLIETSQKLANDVPLNEFVCNFDYYYFTTNLKDIINGSKTITIKNDLINKIVNDLKKIYELIENKDYKNAFDKVQTIIERNKKLFERLS